jgi:hypothetical protein
MLERKYRNIEIESVLNEVKESFLPKGDKRVMVVTLCANINVYLPSLIEINGEEIWELNGRNSIDIMFYNPNNYCTVAYRLNNGYNETGDFIQVANHDSCWRDGVSRCLEEGWKNLDDSFTSDMLELGLSENELLEILKKNIPSLSQGFGISNGFKMIDEPEFHSDESSSDNYNRSLKVNF